MEGLDHMDSAWMWYIGLCKEGPEYQFYQTRVSSGESLKEKLEKDLVRLKLSLIKQFDAADCAVITYLWQSQNELFHSLTQEMQKAYDKEQFVISDEWRSFVPLPCQPA